MKLHVDKEADALYLRLGESAIVESEEVEPGVVLDYNESNEVVGVEFNHLSKRSSQPNPPVFATGDSIVFTPNEMELNRFYFVELNGAPYLYRRVDAGEVEIYGLDD